jgi:hypothetical protein
MTATGPTLARLLRTALDGDPWYGLSTRKWLAGLSAAQAAAHPVPACHSIWELVLHEISWQREVARRLQGAAPADPVEGDWPEVGPATDAAWRDALKLLSDGTSQVASVIEGKGDESLNGYIGGTVRNISLGTGITAYEMTIGLLQHNAYHSGQIALLRRAIEG